MPLQPTAEGRRAKHHAIAKVQLALLTAGMMCTFGTSPIKATPVHCTTLAGSSKHINAVFYLFGIEKLTIENPEHVIIPYSG